MARLGDYIRNPLRIVNSLAARHLLDWMPDEPYLKLRFRAILRRKLDLSNPKTYNEKLQWMKLYDHNPLYITLVDKAAVKPYVENIIGKKYIIPTLGIWDTAEEIDFDTLPNRFVLKCTHDSGGLIICKEKSKLDIRAAKDKLSQALRHNYFYWGREWPYKNLVPRIIAEEYIGGERIPVDYKLYCFDGKVESVMLCLDRDKGYPKFVYFDTKWNRQYYMRKETDIVSGLEKPKNLEEMIEIAEKLSRGLPCVRVDLYNIDGKIYFGEITIFNQDGFDTDITYEVDEYWGSLAKLPGKRV